MMSIYNVIIFIGNVCLAVRRFHDIGKTGLYVLFCLIQIVGIIIVIYYCIFDSELKSNEYGPSPKYSSPQR